MSFEGPRGGLEGGDDLEAFGATQASNLPPTIDVSIPEIEKLKDRKDWDLWLQRVKCALEMMDLSDLISPTIPRPTEDDISYTKWRKAAKAVRFWLLNSISTDIFAKVMNSTRPNTWPDDLIQVIQTVVVGSGYKLSHLLWVRAVQTSRADYGTIQQFVEALRERIQTSIDAEMIITPYQAVSLLLHGIEAEMPSFVQAHLMNLYRAAIKTMKMDRFMELCDAVLDIAISMDVASPAVAPNPSRSSGSRSKTWKRWPREGQTFPEHLAYWLGRGKSRNGKCPYCLEIDHDDTNDCPYLVAKKRKGHWKKQTDLWIYLDPKDRKPPKSSNRSANPSSPETSESSAAAVRTDDKTDMTYELLGASLEASSPAAVLQIGRRWLADSGASQAVCKWFDEIDDFKRLSDEEARRYAYLTANGDTVTPRGKGKATIHLQMDDGSINSITIDCIWNPEAPCNLFPIERVKTDRFCIAQLPRRFYTL